MFPSPDYKALYLDMFRANEKAVRVLLDAQAEAEKHITEHAEPPLRLAELSDESRD